MHSLVGPFFSTTLSGPGKLPAVFILSIMILPTITAISRDALASVPPKLRMAAYGLGATRWETILGVLLPTASRGIFGGIVLGFGRALGETMALAMLVGNANRLTVSLFSPANTLAALLANSFPEAGAKEIPVLMYAALILLAITLVVNIVGALVLERAAGKAVARSSKDSTSSRNELNPADSELQNPLAGVDFAELELSLYRPRTLFTIILSCLVTVMTFVALIPLFAVLWMLIWRGGQKLSLALFTELPPAPLEQGGGFGNAIIGTVIMVGSCSVDHCAAWRSYRSFFGAGAGQQVSRRRPLRR